jgi:hypothetical protein
VKTVTVIYEGVNHYYAVNSAGRMVVYKNKDNYDAARRRGDITAVPTDRKKLIGLAAKGGAMQGAGIGATASKIANMAKIPGADKLGGMKGMGLGAALGAAARATKAAWDTGGVKKDGDQDRGSRRAIKKMRKNPKYAKEMFNKHPWDRDAAEAYMGHLNKGIPVQNKDGYMVKPDDKDYEKYNQIAKDRLYDKYSYATWNLYHRAKQNAASEV